MDDNSANCHISQNQLFCERQVHYVQIAHLPVPAALRVAGGFIMAGARALESQHFGFQKIRLPTNILAETALK